MGTQKKERMKYFFKKKRSAGLLVWCVSCVSIFILLSYLILKKKNDPAAPQCKNKNKKTDDDIYDIIIIK